MKTLLEKYIIGILIYYFISFFIYTSIICLELARYVVLAPVGILILLTFYIIDRTVVLIILCIINKFRPLITNTKFVVSFTIFGYLSYEIVDAIVDIFKLLNNIVGLVSTYAILNIMYIILFLYFDNKKKINKINPLKNVFYLLFKKKSEDISNEDFMYINIVIYSAIFGLYVLLTNIINIVTRWRN